MEKSTYDSAISNSESEKSYHKLLTNFKPTYRRLRGYAFDPSLSNQLKLASINSMIFNIRWEENLKQGPVGEYLEVIDVDPASDTFYQQIDLNNPFVLAQNGLAPSEGNPLFHQQMVYAVAMLTIQNFEKALGRVTLWSSIDYTIDTPEVFVEHLRIYPHALREANAYYSPSKKAILFGYFPANPSNETALMPGSLVFTCLSHDIIAHEVTHALIDGLHKRFMVASHPDTLALHEGFSDIVALFQHFTFTEVLQHQIAQTRGQLESQQILSGLAQQFGLAVGNYGSLRNAIGKYDDDGNWQEVLPDATAYKTHQEPHDRGSILVAAVFHAFISIYNERVRDLYRIATNGTGELPKGEIHPDLVRRLAEEASRTARKVLTMCIRALDYCPPINVTFGDYLRAIITADIDVVPYDSGNYRIAFVESFKRWGIYPIGIRTLSVESLLYQPAFKNEFQSDGKKTTSTQLKCYEKLEKCFRDYFNSIGESSTRKQIFDKNLETKRIIHNILIEASKEDRKVMEKLTGLVLSDDSDGWLLNEEETPLERKLGAHERPEKGFIFKDNFQQNTQDDIEIKCIKIKRKIRPEDFNKKEKKYVSVEVHSIQRSQRVGPDGRIANHVIVTLLQTATVVYTKKGYDSHGEIEFKAGCTIVVSMAGNDEVKVIKKSIDDIERLKNQIRYYEASGETESPFTSSAINKFRNSKISNPTLSEEPFAALHSD
jgi:hypothetical protein